MNCPNGHEVGAGQRFCPSCGKSVETAADDMAAHPGAAPDRDQRRATKPLLWGVAALALAGAVFAAFLIANGSADDGDDLGDAAVSGDSGDAPDAESRSAMDTCVKDAADGLLYIFVDMAGSQSAIRDVQATLGRDSSAYRVVDFSLAAMAQSLRREGPATAEAQARSIASEGCADVVGG